MANNKAAAEKKAADEKETADAGPVFSETLVAKVNREGNHHEVILRGKDSANNIVYRGAKGTAGFKDGAEYEVSFALVHDPNAKDAKAAEGEGEKE